MEKQCRYPLCLMNEDGSSEDPINTNHLYILSNKDSKEDEECSKEFKESME